MSILIGGLIGYFLGNIPGMIIGMIIGSFFLKINLNFETTADYSDSTLLRTLPVLFAWITISNRSPKSLVLNIKRFALQTFGTERAKVFMESYKILTNTDLSFDKLTIACNDISYTFGIQEKYSLLQLLYSVVISRPDFTQSDLDAVKEISNLLGMNFNFNYERVNTGYRETTPDKSPYETLEIHPESSHDEIKKQYRKLSMRYHPDRNANLSDSERIESETKMREINSAYEKIKKDKNIK